MKKRTNNPCKGCVWGQRISEQMIFCPFPKCVRGKLETRRSREGAEKHNGKEKETGVDC